MRNFTNTASVDSITHDYQQIIVRNPYYLSEEMTKIVARGKSKYFSKVTDSTHIKAPVEVCFDLVARQLEEIPNWDPTIRWVMPISHEYVRVGSKSRVTFNLSGSIEEATVVLRSYVPNKVIVWSSNHSNQLQEQWQFRGEYNNSTLVMVTLGYNPYRGWFKYFNRWARMNGQIEKAVSVMLGRLKSVAEMSKTEYCTS